ncbi:MAG: peptidylprolyl isomerase [Leptolyngbya sp. SIO1E4]|nr:peptidylprolyl isomerase [Leptolyngbya sp. SIO1E4]
MTSSDRLIITPEELLHQIKTLAQIPALEEAIATRRIVQSTAHSLGISATPQELQQAADQFRYRNRLQSTQDTFNWLDRHQLTVDDFEEMIRGNVLFTKLAEHLFSEKVEPYFYEHRRHFEQAVLYEVVFEDEDLALECFYAIQEQEISFPEVAHRYIQDQELRRVGGYRGAISRQDLKSEISPAVFAATPPTVLKPILTAQGSHLIFVEDIIPACLTEALNAQIQTELFKNWLREKSNKLKLEFSMGCCEQKSER